MIYGSLGEAAQRRGTTGMPRETVPIEAARRAWSRLLRRNTVRGARPARGRTGHPACLPVAAEPAHDGDARRGPGRLRPQCLRRPGSPGPARDGLGPLGCAEQDHLDGDPQGRHGRRHHCGRLPRADGRPGRTPLPGQRGSAVVRKRSSRTSTPARPTCPPGRRRTPATPGPAPSTANEPSAAHAGPPRSDDAISGSSSFHHASRRDRPSTDRARVTTRKISFKPTSRRSSHASSNQDLPARNRSRDRVDGVPQSICPRRRFRHPQHRIAAETGVDHAAADGDKGRGRRCPGVPITGAAPRNGRPRNRTGGQSSLAARWSARRSRLHGRPPARRRLIAAVEHRLAGSSSHTLPVPWRCRLRCHIFAASRRARPTSHSRLPRGRTASPGRNEPGEGPHWNHPRSAGWMRAGYPDGGTVPPLRQYCPAALVRNCSSTR
jgi:hypothetical protein